MDKKIYSVSEINAEIKNLIKNRYGDIFVQGELSNVKISSQGHCYFSLKDEKALLSGIIYKGQFQTIKFKLENGTKVVAFGKLDVYVKGGQYQLVVESIEPEGKGALQLAFEQLKAKLQKEGLFDAKYKKPIPAYPQRIGIITSPTGAALKDILNVINRRFATVYILVYPAVVQGEEAAPTIVKGIELFNTLFPVDVIIAGRGGGSIEDLWPFNEESVARAIFQSKIPVISAVGHEVDFTIADFVSDLRAPTPSAAAELVIKKKEDVINSIEEASRKIKESLRNTLNQHQMGFDYILERFRNNASGMIITRKNQLEHLLKDFKHMAFNAITAEKNRFSGILNKLNLLNPFSILSRGYSITYKLPENLIVKNTRDVEPEDRLKIKLANGEIFCRVIKEG
ncbi:MAG: exodeoxyribonuclease VII large subunit [Spirochaetes bacterium]|nr:exodeoxyribonuclease VII large subunit [Spirochaetota bacterium]